VIRRCGRQPCSVRSLCSSSSILPAWVQFLNAGDREFPNVITVSEAAVQVDHWIAVDHGIGQRHPCYVVAESIQHRRLWDVDSSTVIDIQHFMDIISQRLMVGHSCNSALSGVAEEAIGR